jgi:hypothetical protein
MNLRPFAIGAAALFLLSGAVHSHEAEAARKEVGRVKFASSCDAKVQPLLETGVAMLHSFWFSATEKTFREMLVQDPSCTVAHWGIAAILMSNPLAGQGASPRMPPRRRPPSMRGAGRHRTFGQRPTNEGPPHVMALRNKHLVHDEGTNNWCAVAAVIAPLGALRNVLHVDVLTCAAPRVPAGTRHRSAHRSRGLRTQGRSSSDVPPE